MLTYRLNEENLMTETTGNETVSDITRAHSTPLSIPPMPVPDPDEDYEEVEEEDEEE